MTCRKTKKLVADMIFEPERTSAEARKHVAECPECSAELSGLTATMKALEEWNVPEPGAFFQAKMDAKLRREMQNAPEGLWARLRSRILYSNRYPVRQLAAGTLAALMAIGAGTYALVYHEQELNTPRLSATVRDLQAFDGEQQLFQQLNALDTPEGSPAGNSN